MQTSTRAPLLIALAALAVFFELGRMPIMTANEGQRAVPPAEMVQSGNYTVPTTSGEPYLAKPPLLYWAIAGIYHAGGVSEWTARIPTALAGCALVLFVYFLGRKHLGEAAAWWAGTAMLASPYFLERARWANIDVPFTLAVFLAVMALWSSAQAQGKARWLRIVGGGVAFGAALLLKGPPAFVFVAAAWLAMTILDAPQRDAALGKGVKGTLVLLAVHVVVWGIGLASLAALSDEFAAARSIEEFKAIDSFGLRLASGWHKAGLGLLVLLWLSIAMGYGRNHKRHAAAAGSIAAIGMLLALPWGVAVVRSLGWDYIQGLLNTEVVERTHLASRINSGSPFFYFYNVVFMTAPWGFLLPMHFGQAQWRARPRLAQFALIAGWLAAAMFTFFAGKEREYILPAIPLLLLATGGDLADIAAGAKRRWMDAWQRWWRLLLAPVFMLAAVGVPIYYLVELEGVLPRIEAGAAFAAGIALAGFYLWQPRRRLAWFYGLTLCVLVTVLVGRSHEFAQDRRNNFGVLGKACAALMEEGWQVETYRRPHSTQPCPVPELIFYAGRPLKLRDFNDFQSVMDALEGEEPYAIVLPEKFAALAAGDQSPEGARILAGPLTRKDLVLVGNRPLPSGILEGGEQAGRPRRDLRDPGEESPNSTGQDAS